jgi:GxxExxY protein
MAELLFRDEVFRIIAAAIEVHRELGAGFAEPVYQEAMQIELTNNEIPFEAQKILRVSYKQRLLEKCYVADIVCFGVILVELKAIDVLSGKEQAPILNYLKATGLKVGLLINFGIPGKLDWQRFIR